MEKSLKPRDKKGGRKGEEVTIWIWEPVWRNKTIYCDLEELHVVYGKLNCLLNR